MGKGIIHQISEQKEYSKLTIEKLETFIDDLPILSINYKEIFNNLKSYTFSDKKRFIILKNKILTGYEYIIKTEVGIVFTGSGGVKDYICSCYKYKVPIDNIIDSIYLSIGGKDVCIKYLESYTKNESSRKIN